MILPTVSQPSDVPFGQFFYLPLPTGGNALCVSAYVETDNVKYNYTVSISWDGRPDCALEIFETSMLSGNAVMVDEARFHVEPQNVCDSTDTCFISDNILYVRVRQGGAGRDQLLNTSTGELSVIAGPFRCGFSQWSVVGALKQERHQLFNPPTGSSG